MSSQTIQVKGNFDAAHRLLGVMSKCTNVHGHTYTYTIHFSFKSVSEQGYAIDFADLKELAKGWIDAHLDHAYIANSLDEAMIKVCNDNNFRLFVMHFSAEKDAPENININPSVENIARVIGLNMSLLVRSNEKLNAARIARGFEFSHIELNETPNFGTTYYAE